MANKRMFSKELVKSDAFLEMPLSTQGLFFQLCMSADDDGFVDGAKRVMRECQATDQDLKKLLEMRYLLEFPESNVYVIKHWKMHNYIQKDRYKPTNYSEEKAMLYTKSNGAYTFDESKAGKMIEPSGYNRKGSTKKPYKNFSERERTPEEMLEMERALLGASKKDK